MERPGGAGSTEVVQKTTGPGNAVDSTSRGLVATETFILLPV